MQEMEDGRRVEPGFEAHPDFDPADFEPRPFTLPERKRALVVVGILLALVLMAVLPPLINVNRFRRRIATSISESLGQAGAYGCRDTECAADAGVYAGEFRGGRRPGVWGGAGDPGELGAGYAAGAVVVAAAGGVFAHIVDGPEREPGAPGGWGLEYREHSAAGCEDRGGSDGAAGGRRSAAVSVYRGDGGAGECEDGAGEDAAWR